MDKSPLAQLLNASHALKTMNVQLSHLFLSVQHISIQMKAKVNANLVQMVLTACTLTHLLPYHFAQLDTTCKH